MSNTKQSQPEETLKRTSTENSNSLNRQEITNNKNVSHSGEPKEIKKKKTKLGIKKEEELSAAYICKTNEVIFFKIVNNKEEFENFLNLSNLEHSFNPLFTNQVINEEEIIIGYKNLKILISLTPRMLYPHIKITYDSHLKIRDDLELLLRKQFEHTYETNPEKFLEKLSDEIGGEKPAPKGDVIFSQKDEENKKSLEIYYFDVLKEKALEENWNFQNICTFFIDGASFIPIENNFWSYFSLYEKNELTMDYTLIGFSSCLDLHSDLYQHRTMISQFLILPPFQRKGYGTLFLDRIYENYQQNPNCLEIVTEDPGIEFIILRDVTLFRKILECGKFDKIIKILDENKIDAGVFKKLKLSREELTELSKLMKVDKNLIRRCVDIFRFIHTKSSKDILKEFKNEMISQIYRINRGDYEIDYLMNKKKGFFISFHDEENFDLENVLDELKATFYQNELTSKYIYKCLENEKLEMLYNELEGDFKEIDAKCHKILNEYRAKKNL